MTTLVLGVGIDLVDLAEFRRICEEFDASQAISCAFVARTFTPAELAQARGATTPANTSPVALP